MIDWISAVLNVPEKFNGGSVVKLSPDGEIESSSVMPVKVFGSYEDTIQVTNIARRRSERGRPLLCGTCKVTSVYITGNPQKFMFGQNIYGTNDIRLLVSEFFRRVSEQLGFNKDVQDRWYHLGLSGRYELTRIDITENYRIGKGYKDVLEWLAAANEGVRCAHKDASMSGGSTLYLGQRSRLHTIKMYCKHTEFKQHFPALLPSAITDKLLVETDGLLRIEATFRARKLRTMGHETAQLLGLIEVNEMYRKSIKNIKLSQQVLNREITRDTVGRGAYAVYLEWAAGFEIKAMLSKAQFYKNRNKLLPYGVDISIPRNDRASNVLPFLRPLEAVPAVCPDWMYDAGLLLKAA